jgi:hypothetical protein
MVDFDDITPPSAAWAGSGAPTFRAKRLMRGSCEV